MNNKNIVAFWLNLAAAILNAFLFGLHLAQDYELIMAINAVFVLVNGGYAFYFMVKMGKDNE